MALRILIVEDHSDTRRTLAGLLAHAGHKISVADCQQKAITVVDSKQFDVVLSDINLPDGTGYDVISHAKRKQKVKSVAISGFGGSDDMRLSKEAGFDFHLTKPLDLQALYSILADFES